jgi:pimeloyl-ACP methyl ester carboxylesterase
MDYDWSKDVAVIKVPTLLVFGDADAVRTAHAVQFFELLGGGKKDKDGGWDGSGMSKVRLSILPGLTHYSICSSPALPATVTPFLRRSDAENELRRTFTVYLPEQEPLAN